MLLQPLVLRKKRLTVKVWDQTEQTNVKIEKVQDKSTINAKFHILKGKEEKNQHMINPFHNHISVQLCKSYIFFMLTGKHLLFLKHW